MTTYHTFVSPERIHLRSGKGVKNMAVEQFVHKANAISIMPCRLCSKENLVPQT